MVLKGAPTVMFLPICDWNGAEEGRGGANRDGVPGLEIVSRTPPHYEFVFQAQVSTAAPFGLLHYTRQWPVVSWGQGGRTCREKLQKCSDLRKKAPSQYSRVVQYDTCPGWLFDLAGQQKKKRRVF